MDKLVFNEKVLQILEDYSYLGASTNDLGTRLIGHKPDIAPKAYVHIVYPPLDESNCLEFCERIQRSVPEKFLDFLKVANGLNLFSGTLRVMGYIPLERQAERHPHNYPSTIIVPNIQGRLSGLEDEDIVIAWHNDNSYVYLNKNGEAIHFLPQESNKVIKKWACFDSWLVFYCKYTS